MPGLTLSQWHEQVGFLPTLIDRLAFDLIDSGHAPANAVAEAVKTLEWVGKTRSTQNGTRVHYSVQRDCREALAEFRLLREAKGSLAKASTPEPWSTSKTSNWVARVGGLPDYIQHVSHGIKRSNPALSESEAIERAIGVVRNWAEGKGHVDAETRAAATKAIAEWEAKKARSHAQTAAKHAAEAEVGEKLFKAVSRLVHIVDPIPNQATFAKRYAHRMSVIEGVLSSLRDRRPPQLAINAARSLLEAPESADVVELAAALVEERKIVQTLMEALGYGTRPIRASEKGHKGKFHGMHGVERAVRTRQHIPHDGEHPVLGAISSGDRLREAAAVAAPPAAAPQSSPVFEDLHPRVPHGPGGGEFAAKGGLGQPGSQAGGGAAGGGGSAALVSALKAADPQLKQVQGELAQSVAFGKAHPTGSKGGTTTVAATQNATAAIQDIGYANDAGGISQFQKDYGIPVTGALDATTMQTIMSAYRGNARYSVARFPDFTGIAGGGAKIRSPRTRTKGRSTLGPTSARRVNAAALSLLGDRALRLVEEVYAEGPAGTPHQPVGGKNDRQPGGDDFDLDEPPRVPPNLRPHEGIHACATCVHFSPAGWITQEQVMGGCMLWTWPVHRLDTCDDWLTLTPPDATLRLFEVRVAEAEEAGDGDAIMEARAGLAAVRDRMDAWADVHPANQWLVEAALLEDYFSASPLWLAEGAVSPGSLAGRARALRESGSYPLADLDRGIVEAWGCAGEDERPALRALLLKMARRASAPAATVDRIRALPVEEADVESARMLWLMESAACVVEGVDLSQAGRRKLAAKGHAMKDGSYPIPNVAFLKKAIKAFGRAKNASAAKAWIIKRAKALNATGLLPEGWLSNASA